MGSALMLWDAPATVDSFVRSPANHMLLHYAAGLRRADRPSRVLDIGCGAGRNAVPLARAGFMTTGTDLSQPMLRAAADRDSCGRLTLLRAAMDALPVRDRHAHSGLSDNNRIALPRRRCFLFHQFGPSCNDSFDLG